MTRPDAMPAIATSTPCSCGQDVHVRHNTVDWVAWCPDCYDPAEDALASALVRGFGPTPTAALGEWHRQHEEVRPLVVTASGLEALRATERVPASTSDVIGDLARDVSIESERQRGWCSRDGTVDEAIAGGCCLDPVAWPRMYGSAP